MSHWRRLGIALLALLAVLVVGTVGYLLLGFGLLDAVYQSVTTVSTVGFREVEPLSPTGQVFTMALILVGVGAALYAFSVLVETVFEGRLNELLGRRHMDKSIASLRGHVIICGWGRVGHSVAGVVVGAGRDLGVGEIRLVQQLDHRGIATQLGHQRVFAGEGDAGIEHLDDDIDLGHDLGNFFAGLVHVAGEPVDGHIRYSLIGDAGPRWGLRAPGDAPNRWHSSQGGAFYLLRPRFDRLFWPGGVTRVAGCPPRQR